MALFEENEKTMKNLVFLLSVSAGLILGAFAAAPVAVPAHPRLFADDARMASVRNFCATDGLGKASAARVVRRADALLETKPVRREVVGRRLLSTSREALARILNFGVAWRLTNDRRYSNRGIAELDAICAFEDWHPSHYLDVGEMALAAAVAYDWFYGEISEEKRRAYARAIAERSLETWLPETIARAKEKYTLHWLQNPNNWNAVCNAGTMAACWALWDDPQEGELAQKIYARARRSVVNGLGCYAPKGAYPEGPMYWGYGTAFACLAVELAREAEGDDSELAAIPGFDRTCEYLDRVTGPTRKYYNFGDGVTDRTLEFPSFWLARRFNRPDTLARHERRLLVEEIKRPAERGSGGEGSRLYPLIVLWLEGGIPDAAAPSEPVIWTSGTNEAPCCTMELPNGAWLAIRGGKAMASHMHMDAGSFVYEAKGKRFVIDYGMEPYHNAEKRGIDLWNGNQDGGRWKCFRLGPEAHAIARLNGELHVAKGMARFVAFETNALPYRVTLDTSALYREGVAARRTFELAADGSLAVTDEFSGLADDDRVTSQLPLVRSEYVLSDASNSDAARLTVVSRGLERTVSDQSARLESWAKPIEPSDRVDFAAIAGSGGKVRLSYTLIPPK